MTSNPVSCGSKLSKRSVSKAYSGKNCPVFYPINLMERPAAESKIEGREERWFWEMKINFYVNLGFLLLVNIVLYGCASNSENHLEKDFGEGVMRFESDVNERIFFPYILNEKKEYGIHRSFVYAVRVLSVNVDGDQIDPSISDGGSSGILGVTSEPRDGPGVYSYSTGYNRIVFFDGTGETGRLVNTYNFSSDYKSLEIIYLIRLYNDNELGPYKVVYIKPAE